MNYTCKEDKKKTLYDLDADPKTRRTFWNVAKGIGIISIVIGHTGSPISGFVYMYHLVLFFFISGYFFKAYPIKTFLSKKLKSLWWPYVYYGLIYIFTHNLFVDLHILDRNHYTSIRAFFASILQTFVFLNQEPLLGTGWFLGTLFYALLFFYITKWMTGHCYRGKKAIEVVTYLIILPILSFYLSTLNIGSSVILFSRALLIIPFIYVGNTLNLCKNKIVLSFPLFTISFLILILCFVSRIRIDISSHTLPTPALFYAISFIGIYFVLCLSKYCLSLKHLTSFIALCGKNSLHIMLLHFLAFILINLFDVYFNSKPISALSEHPISNPDLWILYSIAGIIIPLGLVSIFKYGWNKLQKIKTIQT